MRRMTALLAIAAATALVAGASAGVRGPAATTASTVTSSPAAPSVTPRAGQIVPLGSKVEGECFLRDGVVDSRSASWELSTVIPRFKHGGSGGEILAPAASRIPRIGNAPEPAQGPFKNDWVLEPKLMAFAGPSFGSFGGCQVQSFDPLRALTVEQPGPYAFVQYHSSVGWTATTGSVEDIVAQPCQGNDPEFPDPNGELGPPPDLDDEHQWAIETFCNKTTIVGFHVASISKCTSKADMSKWSGFPYINQYDAGARLGLPQAASDGRRGGNACGPSSLMMAMLSGGPGNLTTLKKTYDATMRRSSAQIAAAEAAAAKLAPRLRVKATKAARENVFTGQNAVAFLKSLGWKSAQVHKLSADVEEMEKTILGTMNGKYPVVISTAFGTNRWGVTGGGHMVAIVGADQRGNFIVNDPAGNYFAAPTGHYGPGKCGYRSVYPHFWLLANVTSRWMLELGKRTRPNRPFLAEAMGPFQPDDAMGLFGLRAAATSPKYGTAFSVLDAHPGAKDAPSTFYLQDAKGRRAGWVEGRVVSGIPDAYVGQDAPGWTDPAAGDESLDKPTSPGQAPRALVVPRLEAGTKLFVSGTKGANFALTALTWQDGKVVATRALGGTARSAPAVVSLPR